MGCVSNDTVHSYERYTVKLSVSISISNRSIFRYIEILEQQTTLTVQIVRYIQSDTAASSDAILISAAKSLENIQRDGDVNWGGKWRLKWLLRGRLSSHQLGDIKFRRPNKILLPNTVHLFGSE